MRESNIENTTDPILQDSPAPQEGGEYQTAETANEQTDNSYGVTRRDALKALGATGGAMVLPGAATAQEDDREPLEINIYQTRRMATTAEVETGDENYALDVMKNSMDTYFQPFADVADDVFNGLEVNLQKEPIELDTAGEYDNPALGIAYRLVEFNGKLGEDDYGRANHSNLLLDDPVGDRVVGIAFMDKGDAIDGEVTDTSVLDYTPFLLELDRDNPQMEGRILDSSGSLAEYGENPENGGLPVYVQSAGLQESGHNLKLEHNEGGGRMVKELNGVELEKEIPAATPMTSGYMISQLGGKRAACAEKEYPEVKTDFACINEAPANCAVRHFYNDTDEVEATAPTSGASEGNLGEWMDSSEMADLADEFGVEAGELEEAMHLDEIPEAIYTELDEQAA